MKRPLITLTSDFAVQSQGVGMMEGVALDISPDANVVHLMHGIPDFDIAFASRSMESVRYLPVGFHVCVVDPGVGTARKAIIIKSKRGDYLIGPDNGVLVSATNFLGGCEKVAEITNPEYMRQPVSPIFHGRDLFTPAAAHLSVGVPMEKFGKEVKFPKLVPAPYAEALVRGGVIEAKVILVNKFGSVILNVRSEVWDCLAVRKGAKLEASIGKKKRIKLPFVETFGDVGKGKPLIMKDDYGRTEAAVNMGSFAGKYGLKAGDKVRITWKK